MTIHYTYRGLSLEYMRGILENVQDKCKRQSFEQIINRDRTLASTKDQLDKILNQKAPEDNPPETREELFRIEERRTEARLLEMGIDSKHMLHFVKTTPGIPEDLRQEMERDYEDKLQAEELEREDILHLAKTAPEMTEEMARIEVRDHENELQEEEYKRKEILHLAKTAPEMTEEMARIWERARGDSFQEEELEYQELLHRSKTNPGLHQSMESARKDTLRREAFDHQQQLKAWKIIDATQEGIGPVDKDGELELDKLIQQQLMKDIGDTQALYASTLNKPEKR